MDTVLARRLAVYLIADPDQARGDLIAAVEDALSGGVTSVQLRAKRLTDRETLALARAVRRRCVPRGALVIVNDRLDLALAAGADGVHLGVDDLPLSDARRLAGSDFVIGYSPETDDQTMRAANEGASYLGIGPVYDTASKNDAGAAIGLETVARRASLARLPVVGIGGITAATAGNVVEAGAVGIAVVGAILHAEDPGAEAERLGRAVRTALARRDG